MKISTTPISGVVVVETTSHVDRRGAFTRLYCERELASILGRRRIVQINHSHTEMTGSVRGLHFQHPPHAEMKFVRCIKGRVWDVAVDLRQGSSTFLRWHGEELTPGNQRMLVIPEGCAHGFQVLEPSSELLYLHTEFYEPASESGLHVDDPRLNVNWPLPVSGLSPRDTGYPFMDDTFSGVAP